jgi:hypothetical protein
MPEVCHGPEEFAIPGATCRRSRARHRDRHGKQLRAHAPVPGTPVLSATLFAKLSEGGDRGAARSGRCRRLRRGSGRRAGRSVRMPCGCPLPKSREKSSRDHPIRVVEVPGQTRDATSRFCPGPNPFIRVGLCAGVTSLRTGLAWFEQPIIPSCATNTPIRGPWSACPSRNIHHHPVGSRSAGAECRAARPRFRAPPTSAGLWKRW